MKVGSKQSRQAAGSDKTSPRLERKAHLDFMPATNGPVVPLQPYMEQVAFASAQSVITGRTPSLGPHSNHSIVATGQGSIPWRDPDQDIQQQQNQLLLVLLHQQHQRQQQQEQQQLALRLFQQEQQHLEKQQQALRLFQQGRQQQEQQRQNFLATTLGLSGFALRPPLPADLSSHLLATSRGTLENALLPQLTSQAMSNRDRERLSELFLFGEGVSASNDTIVADTTSTAKHLRKLPNPQFDTTSLPNPSSDNDLDDGEDENGSTSGFTGDGFAKEKFPFKLYRMLEEAEKNGDDGIVSFLPDGKTFAVHKPFDFVATIMPKFFSTTRISSFQRQLNLYGFRRIATGREKGGYYHECFRRGQKGLCKTIRRKKATIEAQPDSAERGSTTQAFANALPAESGNVSAQAILAQLNQPVLLQRAAPPMQHPTHNLIDHMLPLGDNQRTGLGTSRTIADPNKSLAAAEMMRRQSYLLGQLVLAQQVQHQTLAAPEPGQQGEDSEY